MESYVIMAIWYYMIYYKVYQTRITESLVSLCHDHEFASTNTLSPAVTFKVHTINTGTVTVYDGNGN